MKNLLIVLLSISIVSCDSDDNECTGVDCLPAITQTGAGTFGCLVNGEPFVDTSGRFNCFYQFVNGEYFFNLTANFPNQKPSVISIATNELQISEGLTYDLFNNDTNNFYAEVTFDNNPPTFLNDSTTDINNRGSITINKLDFSANIISAIFNFQVLDHQTQTTYSMTNGRFDAQFTQ